MSSFSTFGEYHRPPLDNPSACPGCKETVPTIADELPTYLCGRCDRWLLKTGLLVLPVMGPIGTRPKIMRVHPPRWGQANSDVARSSAQRQAKTNTVEPLMDRVGNERADDDTAFRPAKEMLREPFDTYKKINKALQANDWIRSRKPSKNRLQIHAGDWSKFLAQRAAVDPLDLPAEVVDAAVREVESGKQKIRDKKAGK